MISRAKRPARTTVRAGARAEQPLGVTALPWCKVYVAKCAVEAAIARLEPRGLLDDFAAFRLKLAVEQLGEIEPYLKQMMDNARPRAQRAAAARKRAADPAAVKATVERERLRKTYGHVKRAAKTLGISERQIRRLIKMRT